MESLTFVFELTLIKYGPEFLCGISRGRVFDQTYTRKRSLRLRIGQPEKSGFACTLPQGPYSPVFQMCPMHCLPSKLSQSQNQ